MAESIDEEDIYAQARFNMVECLLRPGGLRDARLVRRLMQIPRERFVAQECSAIAYADSVLPCGVASMRREMLSPLIFTLMIEAANINSNDIVLDIAGGTGYSAAIIAALASTVIALEEHESFIQIANASWAEFGIDNVIGVSAPLTGGVSKQAPFNVILVNGCIEEVPEALRAQLDESGRLLCVQNIMGSPKLVRINRAGEVSIIADATAPSLSQFDCPTRFTF